METIVENARLNDFFKEFELEYLLDSSFPDQVAYQLKLPKNTIALNSKYSKKEYIGKNRFKNLSRVNPYSDEPIPNENYVANATLGFFNHEHFPCIGAPKVIRSNQLRFCIYKDYYEAFTNAQIFFDMLEFITEYRDKGTEEDNDLTLLVCFEDIKHENIEHADRDFWMVWEKICRVSFEHYDWPEGYSTNPKDNNWSLAILDEPIFVNYSHPHANTLDRRFPYVTYVVNPQKQFDDLRAKGMYDFFKTTIAERQLKLGFKNPFMADIGKASQSNVMTSSNSKPRFDLHNLPSPSKASKCPYLAAKRKFKNLLKLKF